MLKVGDVRVWVSSGNHYKVIKMEGNFVDLLLIHREKGDQRDSNKFTTTQELQRIFSYTRPLTPLEKAMK